MRKVLGTLFLIINVSLSNAQYSKLICSNYANNSGNPPYMSWLELNSGKVVIKDEQDKASPLSLLSIASNRVYSFLVTTLSFCTEDGTVSSTYVDKNEGIVYYFSGKRRDDNTNFNFSTVITVYKYGVNSSLPVNVSDSATFICEQDIWISPNFNINSSAMVHNAWLELSLDFGDTYNVYCYWNDNSIVLSPESIYSIYEKQGPLDLYFRVRYRIGGNEYYTNSIRIPRMIPNAHMPASLLVENNTLKGLDVYDGERYTLHSPISGHYCQSSKSDDVELFPGVYNLRFEGVTQNAVCPVDRTIYVPEISMNTINGNDTINFWYSDEERENVVVVDMPFLDKDSCKVDLSQFELSVNSGDLDFSKLDDEIKIKSFNADGTSGGEASVQAYRYSITSTDKLNTIKIIPKDNSAVIPATYNFKLNSYPKIGVADTLFSQATCHYDLAELEMKNISGGLNGDYVYQIGKASEMNPIPDNGKINIEKIGTGQTSGIVYIYDKDIPDGDTLFFILAHI